MSSIMCLLRSRLAAAKYDRQDPAHGTVVLVRVLLLFESAMYSAITPVLPHYAHVLGASKPAVGVLAGAYPAGIIPGSLIGALIATRAGVRRTTIVGLPRAVMSRPASTSQRGPRGRADSRPSSGSSSRSRC